MRGGGVCCMLKGGVPPLSPTNPWAGAVRTAVLSLGAGAAPVPAALAPGAYPIWAPRAAPPSSSAAALPPPAATTPEPPPPSQLYLRMGTDEALLSLERTLLRAVGECVEAALAHGPKSFEDLMAAMGSRDGREIVRVLDELRRSRGLTRDARGHYLLP